MTTTTPPGPSCKRGDVALALFPDSNLRTAKLRPVLVVQADGLKTGLSQLGQRDSPSQEVIQMRRTVATITLLVLLSIGSLPLEATVDVILGWEHVSFQAEFGAAHQKASVVATTEIRNNAAYLSTLIVTVGKVRASCSKEMIGDLPFPQLGTLHLSYSGEREQLDPYGEFSLSFSFGEEAAAGGRFSEARIQFKGGKLVGRDFAVPLEDGVTQYQSDKPSGLRLPLTSPPRKPPPARTPPLLP